MSPAKDEKAVAAVHRVADELEAIRKDLETKLNGVEEMIAKVAKRPEKSA